MISTFHVCRHCTAGHTVRDQVHMDQGADLFITRFTQPRRLLQKQQLQQWLHQLLLVMLKRATKSPQAAKVAPLPSPPLLSLALIGLPWMIISRLPCLLLVKNAFQGMMLMLIYGLFSMVLLEGRDCRYSPTLMRKSRYSIFDKSMFEPSTPNKVIKSC